jgi:uncharacterized protein (TIGR03437 family)
MTARDLTTGRRTSLFEAEVDRQSAVFMSISGDGSRVLYRKTGYLARMGSPYIADTRTGQSQIITLPDAELVSDGTLNGPGTMAFLVTNNGRLLKVTLSTGMIEELIPATTYVKNLYSLVPGSLVHFLGAFAGSADDWKGRILVNNQTMPIVYVRGDEAAVQTPWELGIGSAPFLLDAGDSSAFQQLQMVAIEQISPGFESLAPGQSSIFPIIMIRSDWSELFQQQPAPGDIVHLYLTGLGPVAGSVQTGIPASTTALNPILGTLNCRFDPQATDAEILFAGLAPGMIGIYQVSLRMPADAGVTPIGDAMCTIVYGGARSSVLYGFGQP